MTDEQIIRILSENRVIACVGCSSKPHRPSHDVAAYMQSHGYRIIPVNPNETEVLGEKAYPDLRSVRDKVDVVQVFRRPEFADALADDAIAIGAKVFWMQDGAGNDAAADKAGAAGLAVVNDDCMMRVHRRLIG